MPDIDFRARLMSSVAAIEKLQSRVRELEQANTEPIAIVGMSCRLCGGADSPEAFWRMLVEGREAVAEISAQRWDADTYYDPNPEAPGKAVTRWAGMLDRVDLFDPHFFRISPREAISMDPKQRFMMELAQEAFDDAGLPAEKLAGSRTGVFVGACDGHEYGQIAAVDIGLSNRHSATGGMRGVIANRISYFYDLRGPSLVVDTVCSSFLTALHYASRSLRAGECEAALVGGIYLLDPIANVWMSKLGVISPDGFCGVFDGRGKGIVLGEGGGCVVIKRLSQARADHDTIHAIIRGTAITQDGRSNGLTAPSGPGQKNMLREAYRAAGVDPNTVHYVDAHGTGTILGDPIEAQALGAVLSTSRPADRPCYIGSVKSNLGHLVAAGSLASLLKVVLAMKHRTLPPSLHFDQPNPYIPFEDLRLKVVQQPMPWPYAPEVPIAGVTALAFGGTNGHVVVEGVATEAETIAPAATPSSALLLPLSAQAPEALRSLALAYRPLIASEGATPSLADLCYSASVRRSHYDERLAISFRSRGELLERLDGFLRGEAQPGVSTGLRLSHRRLKPVFVFCGQGPQLAGMARDLVDQEPVFRAVIERCDALLRARAGFALLEELAAGEAESRLSQTEIAQPALFAIQVALAALWKSWGVTPAAVVGHSMGEVAAAHVAGVLDLEQALEVIVERGRLMQQATGQGKMAAVELSFDEARREIAAHRDRLSIAAINAPRSVVLSGEAAALEEVLGGLAARGVESRRLPVDYAFHSYQMAPAQEALARRLQHLAPAAPTLPMVSTVTGAPVQGTQLDGAYWGRNVREPVSFASAIDRLLADGHNVFIELGPHPVLSKPIGECAKQREAESFTFASLRRATDSKSAMLTALGGLYAIGLAVDFSSIWPTGRLVKLPSYPWQHRPYWLDSAVASPMNPGAPKASSHPLLDLHLEPSDRAGVHLWETSLDRSSLPPSLAAHRFQGQEVLPTAVHLELALAAAAATFGAGTQRLEQVALKSALFLPAEGSKRIQIVLEPDASQSVAFRISSRDTDADGRATWKLHVEGRLGAGAPTLGLPAPPLTPIESLKSSCPTEMGVAAFYETAQRWGLTSGAGTRLVQQLFRGDGQVLARLRLPEDHELGSDAYWVHPAFLDAAFWILGAEPRESNGGTILVVEVGSLRLHRRVPLDRPVWAHARSRTEPGARVTFAEVTLLDDDGAVLLEMSGLRAHHVSLEASRSLELRPEDLRYASTWQRAPAPRAAGSSTPGTWLLVADHGGVAAALAAALRERGDRCVLVESSGEGPQRIGEDHFALSIAQPKQLSELLTMLFGKATPALKGVLHLGALDDLAGVEPSLLGLKRALTQATGGTLSVVQALGAVEWQSAPRLWVITRGTQRVSDEAAPPELAAAPLWGLGRVVGQELPELWGGLVDLPADGQPEADARHLLREIVEPDGEQLIAVRGGERYALRITRQRELPAPPTAGVRPDATYLVTGGLGALGLVVARWLVAQGAKHLALVGRRGVSAQSTRAAIADLERVGVKVLVVKADVAREAEVARLLSEVGAALPPLRGVIHAAGVLDDGVLRHQRWERFETVLAPKVDGAWNLHLHTQKLPLDFFVLFSSVTSLFGATGQANYASANAFLDALARYRRARALPAISIQWGIWSPEIVADDRRGEGLSSSVGDKDIQRWLALGWGHLPISLGTAILGQAIGAASRQPAELGALVLDWSRFLSAYAPGAEPRLFATLAEEALRRPADEPGGGILERLSQAPTDEQMDLLTSYVQAQVSRLLALPPGQPLRPEQGLFDMGMDSLLAVELKNRLQTDFRRTFSSTVLFNHPSVATLAKFLANLVQHTEAATTTAPPSEVHDAADRAGTLARLSQLSDGEAEQALLDQLAALESEARR